MKMVGGGCARADHPRAPAGVARRPDILICAHAGCYHGLLQGGGCACAGRCGLPLGRGACCHGDDVQLRCAVRARRLLFAIGVRTLRALDIVLLL